MLRFFNILTRTSTGILFNTPDIRFSNYVPYVFYDTSTGRTTLKDYYSWRTVTSTGAVTDTTNFSISNATLFPGTATPPPSYSLLDPALFTVLTYVEFMILQNVLQRIDLVRRRLPNPGVVIDSSDGFGNNGVASVAGGYDKKFSVAELMNFIEGSLIEINIHSPATEFYWSFTSTQTEKINNPYHLQNYMGIPYKFLDLIVQGAVIRSLYAWGLLEVDLQFNTSDAGLQITYDKVSSVSSWVDKFLAEFLRQKDIIKMDCVNSYGVGVGTYPFMAAGIWGTAMNMIQTKGTLAMSSMLGFNLRSNTPL